MTLVTITFIVITTLIILAYDGFALYKSKKTEYTISYIILKASLKNPIIPFVFGLLMGHFFWSQCVI